MVRGRVIAIAGGARADPAADPGDVVEQCHALSRSVADRRRIQREQNLREAAAGRLDADVVLRRLDAMRWLDSSVYHVWRVVHHTATRTSGSQAAPE